MLLRGFFVVLGALLLIATEAPCITLQLPRDSLRIGKTVRNGQDLFVPVLIDSFAVSDSVVGFRVKIVYDIARVSAVGVATLGTLSDNDHFQVSGEVDSSRTVDGVVYPAGYIVTIISTDAVTPIVGSGILVNVDFIVMNDTAGVVPLTFDSVWTEIDRGVGPDLEKLACEMVNGGLTFVPTMDVTVQSNSWRFSQDTLVSIPILYSGGAGDIVKEMSFQLRTNHSVMPFADFDTSGSLVGSVVADGSWSHVFSDSGGIFRFSAARNSAIPLVGATDTLIVLKALLVGTSSFQSSILIDSVRVEGFAEPYETSKQSGAFQCTYMAPQDVKESAVTLFEAGPVLFPNPASESVTLTGLGVKRFEIMDINGNCLSTWRQYAGRSIAVDTGNLPNGMYVLRLDTADGMQAMRLAVVH